MGPDGALLHATPAGNRGAWEKVAEAWQGQAFQDICFGKDRFHVRDCTADRFIASSAGNAGHLVGARASWKGRRVRILARVVGDAPIFLAYTELTRVAQAIARGQEAVLEGERNPPPREAPARPGKKHTRETPAKTTVKPTPKRAVKPVAGTDVTFTARLMAHFRAVEGQRDSPLFVDPLAGRLAGDLATYLKAHPRYSRSDYPVVRMHHVNAVLLGPWCRAHPTGQVVLLGAGLDARAYWFPPLARGSHVVFEVDLPAIVRYKNECLRDEPAGCPVRRLAADCSRDPWLDRLHAAGLSRAVPTLWILEGLLYYLPRASARTLLLQCSRWSQAAPGSGMFADLMHHSRWLETGAQADGLAGGPYSPHVRWGIDIHDVPGFFDALGWSVMFSFADEHDHGRDVGQRAMIFVTGRPEDLETPEESKESENPRGSF